MCCFTVRILLTHSPMTGPDSSKAVNAATKQHRAGLPIHITLSVTLQTKHTSKPAKRGASTYRGLLAQYPQINVFGCAKNTGIALLSPLKVSILPYSLQAGGAVRSL